jgi:excisionase family DNA binding protein
MRDHATEACRGWTVRELAAYLRIGKDRLRGMIQRGEMPALNLAPHRCGRPRYVVLPEHLAQWERSRRVSPPPRPAPRRQRKPEGWIDYYPDP